MPYKSEKQRKAMKAAEKGQSKTGIPQAVAKRFAQHGRKK